MDIYVQLIALVAVTIVVGGALRFMFRTKIEGFGPYTTALPIILVALYLAALGLIFGKLGPEHIANLLFAALGYGGGLLTTKLVG